MIRVKHRDPEREDLSHLSAFHRYALCPISHQLSLLATASKPTKDSEAGARGHRKLAGEDVPVSNDESDTIMACMDQETELVESIANGAEILLVEREKRLFYDVRGEHLFTGAPDVVYVLDDYHKTAIILDYKLGFLGVPNASVNLQLRGAALLAWQNYRSRAAYVAIIQPNVSKWSRPAFYDYKALTWARGEIKELISGTHSPDAQANPSAEACRHCPAKLICKAAYNPTLAIATRKAEVVLDFSDKDLSTFGELIEQAEFIINVAWEELKQRVANRPEAFPNWYFQSSGHTSRIDNPQAAFAKFANIVSAKEFSDICKPSIHGLVDLMRSHTGMSKPMARAEVERRLGELLIKKPKQPSLKRKQVWEAKELTV
jgi:hypothetical protein